MKKLSDEISATEALITAQNITSISFDIDGTLYPILKVQLRWWLRSIYKPLGALKFYSIKRRWEKIRLGSDETASAEDIRFFEHYLVNELLHEGLVPKEVRDWLADLVHRKVRVYFLSDHGAALKLKALNLGDAGIPINCLVETQHLKPHAKIATLLRERYGLDPLTHLHLGDRWTDEEQARIFGCSFRYFTP